MTDVIREVDSLSMGSIHVSCLVLWTARDQVVDIHKSITKLMNLGSDKKIFVEIDTSEHVLAGDITSPETTTKTIETITQFLKKL